MHEIRFHGKGGQGLVRAGQICVQSAIDVGMYAAFSPFFGVERRGSPVYGHLRMDSKPIRVKMQVYKPECIVLLDQSLLDEVNVYDGLRKNGILIINSNLNPDELNIPGYIYKVGIVDATSIAFNFLGKNIPNTVMLGAFCRTTGWLPLEVISRNIEAQFNKENAEACARGYDNTRIVVIK